MNSRPPAEEKARRKIQVRGVVQGVGFRPFVYRLAHEHGLGGWVLNHSGGVEIEVEGPPPTLEAFARDVTALAPPLARIVGVEVEDLRPAGYGQFEIRHSVAEEGRYQLISPDIATCADCLAEILDPNDRRFRYPFTNCTNCGPRFTIIRDIPYDRPRTTMQRFTMCAECQAEYDDPLDRRFHAQPNACPACGPRLWLETANCPGQNRAEGDSALRLAGQLLAEGRVLALKGLGGFHLACDATDPRAVDLLRRRKGRPAKPLAVMMATLDDVRRHCLVSAEEQALLSSPECPIVLLRWHEDSTVAREVAPQNLYLGVMLPYTPLHHILLRDVGRPVVMTSGNLSEEPIAQDNEEARHRLGPLADAFLLHNRDIYARYDDSVWFQARGPAGPERAPLRRSRGYAPFPVRLPCHTPPVLATGAELKNTFCLARDDFAFLSQHIGDMENLETLEHFQTSIGLYRHLFRVEPEIIAHDLHPDYLATRYALSPEADGGIAIPRVAVQHHEAHIASCLVDNAWPAAEPVIGVAWDGTGYGRDGHLWGSEFLVGGYEGLRRAAHVEYLPLPGGEAAILNPWRLAVGAVYHLTGQATALPGIAPQELEIVRRQVERRVNTPWTAAVGRLFDTVAALAGVRTAVTYEAQAAIELEMLATRWAERDLAPYPFTLDNGPDLTVIRVGELLSAIVEDVQAGATAGQVGWRFHRTLAAMMGAVCRRLAAETGVRTVALSGGCFQNRLLSSLAVAELEQAGFRVLVHHQVPCNDGGVSLGQAVMAHLAGGG